MSTWKTRAAVAASGDERRPALPVWEDGAPWCDDRCSHHDGKRCALIGVRPGRICEPVVVEMARMLDGERSGEG